MKTFVIYGAQSKIIRRIIVSDSLQSVAPEIGEGVLEVPFEEYNLKNDGELRQHVAKQIGEPLHDGRTVEVDQNGAVVAIYNADPLIDKPLLHENNTLEAHKDAVVGDVKIADAFPVKEIIREIPKSIPPEDQKRIDDYSKKLQDLNKIN